MKQSTYITTLTLIGFGLLGAVISLGLAIAGVDPATYLGGTWVWIMVLGTLAAELIIYASWRMTIPSTAFRKQLQSMAVFMAIYVIIVNFDNGLLYLIALAVTFVAWNRLYTEAGGASLKNNEEALTLLIFARLLVRPLIGVIFLLLEAIGVVSALELLLVNVLTAIVVGVLAYYTYLFIQPS